LNGSNVNHLIIHRALDDMSCTSRKGERISRKGTVRKGTVVRDVRKRTVTGVCRPVSTSYGEETQREMVLGKALAKGSPRASLRSSSKTFEVAAARLLKVYGQSFLFRKNEEFPSNVARPRARDASGDVSPLIPPSRTGTRTRHRPV